MLAHLAQIDTSTHNGLGILCVILFIAMVIAIIVGLAELIGFGFVGNRLGGNRFGPLVVGIILLIIWLVLC